MLKMSSHLDNIINAYKILTKVPAVISSRLNKATNTITAKWAVRNLNKNKKSKYLTTHHLDHSFNVIAESEFGVDVSNELLSTVSPREVFKALIYEDNSNKDKKKQYLEVWNHNTLVQCIDLTALDIHGDVYADSEFGSLEWSHDETMLVYVAEKKLPKMEPYIKMKPEGMKQDGSGETVPIKGEEYVYRQDWGEQLVGKHLSVVVVWNITSMTFTVLDGLPDSWCPGQVQFAPCGSRVIGVAWESEPRRLGLMFCTNRPGYVFSLPLNGPLSGPPSKLSSEGMSVRSPRACAAGVVWLQRPRGGPHHACHQLVILKNGDTEATTIMDIVDTEIRTANGYSFHGVYCLSLPKKCFSADGNRIVFSTPQKCEVRSYVIDIEGGRLVDISNRRCPGSTSVLDVTNDVILATCTNITTPDELFVARLPARGQEDEIQWQRVTTAPEVPTLHSAAVEYLYPEHSETEHAVKSFSALYFAPETKGTLPLIVWPHGGPHSTFVNAYSIEAALFILLGFACIQVNYRGSTGAGQTSLQILPKHVGDADVKDCKLATDVVLTKYPIDARKLCLFGGSHGGFLVTHLSGQYPDVYAAVVSRNPAIDVASMFSTTDIADWCAVEAGFEFSEQGPISEEQLLAMRRCSPIVHVHRVRAPTALMLGGGDKRVPCHQGLDYARRLKANGVPTRVYMYDDNHSLSSIPVEMDNLINGAKWFMEHLQS